MKGPPDAYFRVIDFDFIDDGAKLGAAERDFSCQHVGAHDFSEGGELLFCNTRIGTHFGHGTVEGSLRYVALRFDGRNAILERGIAE